MDRKNLFAWTEINQHLPAYVSVNHETDGRITMAVRERRGGQVCIPLAPEQLRDLGNALLEAAERAQPNTK